MTPRRVLGPATCVLLGLTTIVGGAIFVLPPLLARSLGPLSFLAFLGAGGAVAVIGLMTAEAAGTTERAGGVFQYVSAAFGPRTGFAAAWLAWLATVLAWSGGALAFARLAEPVDLDPRVVATAVIAGLGLVNALGARPGAAVSNALAFAKLVPLALFAALGLATLDPRSFDGGLERLAAAGTAGIGAAIYRCIYATGGFETIGAVAGEVRDPKRTIPRAVLLAIGSSVVLYALVQAAATGALADLGASADASAPGTLALPEAARRIGDRIAPGGGRPFRALVAAGAAISLLGMGAGAALISPRYLFAMAEGGFAPPVLLRTSRSGAPVVAVIAVTALAIAAVWTYGWLALVDLTVLFSLIQFGATAAAAWRLRRIVPVEGRFVAPGGPLVPVLALGTVGALLAVSLAGEEISKGQAGALAAALAAGAAVAGLTRLLSRPKAASRESR